jgi:hypothetical protein
MTKISRLRIKLAKVSGRIEQRYGPRRQLFDVVFLLRNPSKRSGYYMNE